LQCGTAPGYLGGTGLLEAWLQRAVEQAPFLTATQKRAILCDNAARFLRLALGVCH
jgi:hypothetical protein